MLAFVLLGIALAGAIMIPDLPGDEAEADDGWSDEDEVTIVPIGEVAPGQGSEDAADDDLDDDPAGEVGTHVVIHSGPGDDSVTGTDFDDYLHGQDGDDTLSGEAGDDEQHGGPGHDLLVGGDGDDSLFGHIGDDMLHGDGGDDLLVGGNGDDLIPGGAGDDSLQGNLGDDGLIGGAGRDVSHGGTGNDLIDGVTGEEDGPEADFLNGGAGDDRLIGGTLDWMNGGTGSDSLVLADVAQGPATIEGFDPAEDVIMLRYDPAGPVPDLSIASAAGGVTLLAGGVAVATILGTDELDLTLVELVAA